MKLLFLVGYLISIASAQMCSWDYGHLLTARIAQIILEKEDPKTLKSAQAILETLKITDPSWTESEGKHPFTESAIYADFIKHKKSGQY